MRLTHLPRVALLALALLTTPATAGKTAADEAGDVDAAPMIVVSNWVASAPAIRGEQVFRAAMLDAHNRERSAHGVSPLQWSAELEGAARDYARQLAQTAQFRHSNGQSGSGQGENLWMGTTSAFSYDEMVASWLDESDAFQQGSFPAVSRTGSWHDVGHYTQMIWAETTTVGCAVASNRSDDYLVCRYDPPGNVYGGNPIGVQKASATSFRNASAR